MDRGGQQQPRRGHEDRVEPISDESCHLEGATGRQDRRLTVRVAEFGRQRARRDRGEPPHHGPDDEGQDEGRQDRGLRIGLRPRRQECRSPALTSEAIANQIGKAAS